MYTSVNSLNCILKAIGSQCNRLYRTKKKKMYIFNVYLPYDKLDNEEEYIDRLAKLHNILAECDSTCVAVVGDYNANVLKKC